jgi:hypothetical protein
MSADCRPETELLLQAARVQVGPAEAGRLRSLVRPDLDWGAVAREALRHGVLPLVYRNVTGACAGAVPAEVRDSLREQSRGLAAHNLLLTGELFELLELFEGRGIPALPFKGPVLAAATYGSLALRPFWDLDLLVRPADVRAAWGLLVARGYRLGRSLNAAGGEACLRRNGQLPFVGGDCHVELHTHVLPPAFRFFPDLERMWVRAGPVLVQGREVATLAPEDLLLFLCAHGAKHLWGRLLWICDIAELIRTYPALDWVALARQAQVLRSGRLFRLGLRLAHAVLGAPLPSPLAREVRGDRRVAALAARRRRRLFREVPDERSYVETGLFQLQARDRWHDAVGYLLHEQLAPDQFDWASLALPPRLDFLYYLWRPLRRLWRLGRRLFRRPLRTAPARVPGQAPAGRASF